MASLLPYQFTLTLLLRPSLLLRQFALMLSELALISLLYL